MNQPLKEFKKKFIENLLEIHWKHWTALGIASHFQPERHWTLQKIGGSKIFFKNLAYSDRIKKINYVHSKISLYK